MAVLTWSLKNNYGLKQALNVKRWKERYKGKAVVKKKLHKQGTFIMFSKYLLWDSLLN